MRSESPSTRATSAAPGVAEEAQDRPGAMIELAKSNGCGNHRCSKCRAVANWHTATTPARCWHYFADRSFADRSFADRSFADRSFADRDASTNPQECVGIDSNPSGAPAAASRRYLGPSEYSRARCKSMPPDGTDGTGFGRKSQERCYSCW